MAALTVAGLLVLYAAGYLFYSKFLAEKVFRLRPDYVTPAHRLNDGIDYVPTRPFILFGHHYASIAGLAPMLGPAVAVIWGWLPATLWVVLGALFVGCVHDFGSLVLSVRADGRSIGALVEGVISKRAKTLFHLVIFFLVSLAMGVFVFIIAFLFSPSPDASQNAVHFPQAVVPSFGLILVAMVIGILVYKKGMNWGLLTGAGIAITLGLTFLSAQDSFMAASGLADPAVAPGREGWSWILLAYAFAASVLPVWMLLQPRDFINSTLLYVGLSLLYISFFIYSPSFHAPAVKTDVPGAPSVFPFVFIIIACGAASGFHSLVSSGTTAKQLNRESDARVIGYGGMIGESLLGLMAVLATTAGLSAAEYAEQYASWDRIQSLGPKIGSFILGCSRFLETIGIDPATGSAMVALVVVSYALTSLDSATRLLRYNIEEMAHGIGISSLNRYISSTLAIAAIAFFAFYKIDGKVAGLALWKLFGTTNQLLAGLALLVISLYLLWRGRRWYVAGLPMVFVLFATIWAMTKGIIDFYNRSEWPLFVLGVLLLALAVWLMVEAAIAVQKFKQNPVIIDDEDITFAAAAAAGTRE